MKTEWKNSWKTKRRNKRCHCKEIIAEWVRGRSCGRWNEKEKKKADYMSHLWNTMSLIVREMIVDRKMSKFTWIFSTSTPPSKSSSRKLKGETHSLTRKYSSSYEFYFTYGLFAGGFFHPYTCMCVLVRLRVLSLCLYT